MKEASWLNFLLTSKSSSYFSFSDFNKFEEERKKIFFRFQKILKNYLEGFFAPKPFPIFFRLLNMIEEGGER